MLRQLHHGGSCLWVYVRLCIVLYFKKWKNLLPKMPYNFISGHFRYLRLTFFGASNLIVKVYFTSHWRTMADFPKKHHLKVPFYVIKFWLCEKKLENQRWKWYYLWHLQLSKSTFWTIIQLLRYVSTRAGTFNSNPGYTRPSTRSFE